MAKAGDVLDNPVTGQRLIIRKTSAETNGELLEMESVYTKPTPARPSAHFHPYQEEQFEVLAGEVHTQIDGAVRRYGPGETFAIPPGTPHAMWAEQAGVRVNWQTRPALETEVFFETASALARAGKVDERGVPTLLQAAVIGREYEDMYRLAAPPWPVQKTVLAVLAPIGRLLGHHVPLTHESRATPAHSAGEWGPRSASWRLAALAGAALVALGAYGLTRPKAAAETFGMPIRNPRDVPSWRPKAARDLATGVIPLSLVALGEKRALAACAAASALIPALDAVLVARSGSGKPWQVAMHGSTAGLTLALAIALFRPRAAPRDPGTAA